MAQNGFIHSLNMGSTGGRALFGAEDSVKCTGYWQAWPAWAFQILLISEKGVGWGGLLTLLCCRTYLEFSDHFEASRLVFGSVTGFVLIPDSAGRTPSGSQIWDS